MATFWKDNQEGQGRQGRWGREVHGPFYSSAHWRRVFCGFRPLMQRMSSR